MSRRTPLCSANGQQAFQQCITTISTKFHQVVTYQPASRFWAFQTYETLLFVVASAALAGLCVWWVRRPAQLNRTH